MNTQHKLRELLARVKTIRCDYAVSYSAIVQWRSNDPERQIKRIIADKVAHEIAAEVMRVGTWSKTRGPDGEVFSVRGIWMDYDSLYRLVEDAYSMGRTEPVGFKCNPLYTAPPKRELTCVCGAVWEVETMVHPPRKREWVGLTHPQIHELDWPDGVSFEDILLFARAIEAKLKEKNHG